MNAGTVYLLHFDEPYKHARHYVGWATNVKRRLAEHEAGRGARLLAVVRDAGIGWQLARLWPGSRARERQIKRQGGHARQCPLCGVTPRRVPRNADGSLSRSRTTDAKVSIRCVIMASNSAALLGISLYSVLVEMPARRATLSMLVAAKPLLANCRRAASRITSRVSWSERS